MYKVMLIDDDVPILKYLRQLLDWGRLDLHIAADTYSSVKALRMFQELMPDIVVSDIGLPQINGVELACEFIRMKPNVRIIFLTCHEDFNYAKQALQINADDYLIKDELTAGKLEQSLQKSIRLLRHSAIGLEQFSYREDLSRHIDLLKESLLQQMLKGVNTEETLEFAGRLGIRVDAPFFLIGVGELFYASLVPQYDYKDVPVIRYGIYNIADELAKGFEGFIVFNGKNHLVILLNYRSSLKMNMQQYWQDYVGQLKMKCQQFLKIRMSFTGLSKGVELEALGLAYKHLLRKRQDAYYSGQSIVLLQGQEEETRETGLDSYEEEKNNILQAVEEVNADLLERTLQKLAKDALKKRPAVESFLQMCSQWVRLIELQHAKAKSDEEYHSSLRLSPRLSDTLEMLGWKLKAFLQTVHTMDEPKGNEMKLRMINDYINKHLSENITSIDVAQHLFLNPSYFSRYFKRMTGENFTDYVHRLKMRIASKWLEQKDETIEIVALKLGYSDRTYFSKVFKKYIGVTPSDYKSRTT